MAEEQLSFGEILEKVESTGSRKDKIELLKKYYSRELHEALAFGYDERVKWLLPEGEPPYKPLESHEAKSALMQEIRKQKLYYFVQGGKSPDLKQHRREMLFLDVLESIDPKDAKLLLALKNKQIPYRGVTKKLIEDAYGELK